MRQPTPLRQPELAAEPLRPGTLRAHLRDPLYRTAYLLIAGTGITTLVGFVFWGLAAHTYSAKAVGINSAAISAMLLVSAASSLGLEAVLVRYLPTAGLSARALIVRSYAATTILSLALGAGAALTSPIWSPSLRFLGDRPGWFIGFTLATAAWSVFFLQDSVMVGLRSAQWVPLENSLYSVVKLILLVALAASLPGAGLFVAWNAPVGVAIAFVSLLIFGRLIPARRKRRADPLPDRRRIVSVAVGNYGGTLFSVAGLTLLPILVTDQTNATQTAYFYVPWMIAAGLQLIALNMMMSLTVEGALDESRLRGLLRKAFLHTSRLVLPLAIACGVGAPWVLRAFGSHYAHAGAPLLRLLAAGMLPNILVALAIGVARVQHRGMAVLGIEGARAGLVIGLSIVLLPSVGIEGVGIAWLVAQLAVAIVLVAGMLRPLLAPAR